MEITFVEFDENILDKTFDWLQDEELRYLIDAKPISKDEQRLWYESLPDKNDYYIKGVMCDNVPIGVVGIKHINSYQGEYWGYIGNKNYWSLGIGKRMVSQMIIDAKEKFNISCLTLRVLSDNERAINLYKKFGFLVVEQEDKNIEMQLSI